MCAVFPRVLSSQIEQSTAIGARMQLDHLIMSAPKQRTQTTPPQQTTETTTGSSVPEESTQAPSRAQSSRGHDGPSPIHPHLHIAAVRHCIAISDLRTLFGSEIDLDFANKTIVPVLHSSTMRCGRFSFSSRPSSKRQSGGGQLLYQFIQPASASTGLCHSESEFQHIALVAVPHSHPYIRSSARTGAKRKSHPFHDCSLTTGGPTTAQALSSSPGTAKQTQGAKHGHLIGFLRALKREWPELYSAAVGTQLGESPPSGPEHKAVTEWFKHISKEMSQYLPAPSRPVLAASLSAVTGSSESELANPRRVFHGYSVSSDMDPIRQKIRESRAAAEAKGRGEPVDLERLKRKREQVADDLQNEFVSFIQTAVRVAHQTEAGTKTITVGDMKVKVAANMSTTKVEEMHDTLILLQVADRIRTTNLMQANTKMIFELVIRPIISIMKKMVMLAGEKILAMFSVKFLTTFLGELISMWPAPPGPDVADPDLAPPDVTPPEDTWGFLETASTIKSQGRTRLKAKEREEARSRFKAALVTASNLRSSAIGGTGEKGSDAGAALLSGRGGEDITDASKTASKSKIMSKAELAHMSYSTIRESAAAQLAMRSGLETQLRQQLGARVGARSTVAAKVDDRTYDEAASEMGMASSVSSVQRDAEYARFRAQLDVAAHSAQRVKFITQPLLDIIEPKLLDALTQSVSDTGQMSLEKVMSKDLVDDLRQSVNRSVGRNVVRELTTQMTEQLSHKVVDATSKILTKSLTELSTKYITRAMVPPLTYGLSLTISHALTRHPINDYYCYYCLKEKYYCDDCRSIMLNDYYLDFYSVYYSRYYEKYYTYYYGDYFAKLFCNSMTQPWFYGGAGDAKIKHINHACLDPDSDVCQDTRKTPRQNSIPVRP